MEIFVLIVTYGDTPVSEPIGAYRDYRDCVQAKLDCELADDAGGDSNLYEIKVMKLE